MTTTPRSTGFLDANVDGDDLTSALQKFGLDVKKAGDP